MWQIIASRISARAAGYVAFPLAVIVGTIGVWFERRYTENRKEIPYLEKSIQQQRNERLMNEEYKISST
uniref:Uncharacterized protein n=1 Tax=Panagrolaimus sp. PS1159 TaxID=55785 RepID=A0AC35GJI8_9BILA